MAEERHSQEWWAGYARGRADEIKANEGITPSISDLRKTAIMEAAMTVEELFEETKKRIPDAPDSVWFVLGQAEGLILKLISKERDGDLPTDH